MQSLCKKKIPSCSLRAACYVSAMADKKPGEIGYATRHMPKALLDSVDEYAAQTAGATGKPSRDKALFALLERGLKDATRERRKA
jgi:hypothetical protein